MEQTKNTRTQEQILVRITGQDRPGLTASVMGILAKYDAQILDIGQADIHSTLSLGILIRMDEANSGQVMKELLFKATELGVNIGFSPISDDEYEDWVGHQGKNRYILMVMGRVLEARQIEAATRVIADQGFNIDAIRRMTGRKSIKNPGKHIRACIELSLRGEPADRQEMQRQLMKLSAEMEIDFSYGNRLLVPARRYVPPHAPPHLLRHGLDAHPDGVHRRAGRAQRRR